MQWNNKFIYPKSTRSIVQGSRHYSVNEKNLPSVTTILKATESEEKKAKLAEWKNRELVINKLKLFQERQQVVVVLCMIIWKNFLLGKLNMDLLGDNSREKMMAIKLLKMV